MTRCTFLVITSVVVGFASGAWAQPQEGSPPPAATAPPATPTDGNVPSPPQALPPPSLSQPPPSLSQPPPPSQPSSPPGYWTAPPDGYLTAPQPPRDLQPGDHGYRSPMTALALSLGLTLGGYGVSFWAQYKQREALSSPTDQASGTVRALGTAGSLVGLIGPTTGHIYAGKVWNPGLKWRLISLGTLTVTAVFFVAATFSSGGDASNDTIALLAIGVIASAAGYLGATIYEIATAPAAARKHNRRSANVSVTIAPVIGREPGLAVIGMF